MSAQQNNDQGVKVSDLLRRAQGLRRYVVDSPTPLTQAEQVTFFKASARVADDILAASENLLRRAELPTSHRPS